MPPCPLCPALGAVKQPLSSPFLPWALHSHSSELPHHCSEDSRGAPMKALLLPPGAGHGAAQLPVTFQRGRQSLGFQCPPSLMEGSLEKNWWMSSMVISLIFTSMGPSVEQEKQRGEDLLWCWGSSCCIPVHHPQHSAAFLQHQQKQSGNAAGVTPQPPQPLWLLLDALHVSPPPGVPLCSSLRVSSRLNPPPQQRALPPLETFAPKAQFPT